MLKYFLIASLALTAMCIAPDAEANCLLPMGTDCIQAEPSFDAYVSNSTDELIQLCLSELHYEGTERIGATEHGCFSIEAKTEAVLIVENLPHASKYSATGYGTLSGKQWLWTEVTVPQAEPIFIFNAQ